MHAITPSRRLVRTFVRGSVVVLLAGLMHVVSATPASAAEPFGDVNEVESLEPGRVHIRGWAIDSDDVNAAVRVHIYFGPTADYGYDLGPAASYRPDVGQAYPGAGDNHGLDTSIDVPISGTYDWHVYLIDPQAVSNPLIESGTVTIADATPTGGVEPATSTVHRTVDLKGWASDPNAPSSPVQIEAYIGGSFNTPGVEYRPLTANTARADGTKGFSQQVTTTKTGIQDIYLYAINVPGTPGGNRLIGTVRVTVYVDTTPPQTTITSAPATATTRDIVYVTFSANEPNATFECRWDVEPWFACQGGTKVSLTAGKHQVSVRATDQYGNTDQSSAVFLVTVTEAGPPPPTPGEPSGRTVAARAVKKKSKLRIDVAPDSAKSNYRVVIQRKVGKKWRKVARVRTRGKRDVVVVDLGRGKYRVVLPKSAQGPAATTGTVRLKR